MPVEPPRVVPPIRMPAEASIRVLTEPDARKVYERDLTDDTDRPSASTAGKIALTATDRIHSLTIDAQSFSLEALSKEPIKTACGVLTLTQITLNANGTEALIDYIYALTTAQYHDRHTGHDHELDDVIALLVTGMEGSSASAQITITIVDDAPTAVVIEGGTVFEDAVNNTLKGNIFDYARIGADVPQNPAPLVTWHLTEAQHKEIDRYGKLNLNSDGSWQFVLDNSLPDVDKLGNHSLLPFELAYTLTDADGDSASEVLRFAIQGSNDAPRLKSHVEQGRENRPITGNVLNDASDAEGDELTVVQFTLGGTTYALESWGAIAYIYHTDQYGESVAGSFEIQTNGDYSLSMSDYWHGAIPQITYVVTDGTDTSSATLDLTLQSVNDPPVIYESLERTVATGQTYVFSTEDFPFSDWRDEEYGGTANALKAVIIESLPAGGSLLLDGEAVTAGQLILAADLQAGKLVYQAGAQHSGEARFPFSFRIQDDGGTDHGGKDTSAPHMFYLDVNRVVQGDNFHNTIQGGHGNDLLIGDRGGVDKPILNGADANIALVVDLSAEINQYWKGESGRVQRIKTVKQALNSLLNEQLLSYPGKLNVSLITLRGADIAERVSVTDLRADNINSILREVGQMRPVVYGKSIPYATAFNQAKAYFDRQANNGDYDHYQNLTLFLTASKPSDAVADRADAFNALKAVSTVHTIDLAMGDPSILDPYDTTGAQGERIDSNTYVMHADFQDDMGANQLNAWEMVGGGAMTKQDGRLRIDSEVAPDYLYRGTTVTQREDQAMVVTDTHGAYFRFDVSAKQQGDYLLWRLLKWDGAANNGQGDWIVAEIGSAANHTLKLGKINTITTLRHNPGLYRLEFEAAFLFGHDKHTTLFIDNIQIHGVTPIGQPRIAKAPEDLSGALDLVNAVPARLGDDTIFGNYGQDIIFGDALYTDGLPWGKDGNPDKPLDKDGIEALRYFLAATSPLGHAPSNDELHAYIFQNPDQFNDTRDIPGGNDTLYAWQDFGGGGGGDSILYGGGGNDILYGGGGNDFLYGGAGNDTLDGTLGNDTLIGGPGNDTMTGGEGNNTFMWLKGDAGTVARPAVDTITDFGRVNWGAGTFGRDVLNLRELLEDAYAKDTDLSHFFYISRVGRDTVIQVSSTGELHADGSYFDQKILLKHIDLTHGWTDQNQIINDLIQSGKLLVDM